MQEKKNNGKHFLLNKMSFSKTPRMLLFAGLCLIALIQIYPFIFLLFFSLKSNSEIFGGNIGWIPKTFVWENYAVAFGKGKVGLYFVNSVIVTLLTTLLTVLVSSMAAFGITRMKWKFSRSMLLIFLLGLMIPVHVSLLPLYIFFKNLKLLNSYWCLILPYVGFTMSMAMYILSGFLQGIPRELEEAAVIDGCNIFHIFVHITLPIIRPAIMTASIFVFLFAWNELMFALTFNSKAQFMTLTAGLRQMVGQYSAQWGPIGAGLVVATIPTMLIYMMMSSQVQKSFTAGAVKG